MFKISPFCRGKVSHCFTDCRSILLLFRVPCSLFSHGLSFFSCISECIIPQVITSFRIRKMFKLCCVYRRVTGWGGAFPASWLSPRSNKVTDTVARGKQRYYQLPQSLHSRLALQSVFLNPYLLKEGTLLAL